MENQVSIFRLRATSIALLLMGLACVYLVVRLESWIVGIPVLFAFQMAVLAWLAANQESKKKKKNDEEL